MVTLYQYEPVYSKLTREERFGGRITRFEYDGNGNLTSILDPMQNLTTMTYDSRGLLETWTRPTGNLTPDPDDYTASYTYNDAGHVLTRTTDLPSEVSHQYDPRGNRTDLIDANMHPTGYRYDLLDRLIGTTDALLNEMSFTYDATGNMIALTDQLDRTTTYGYDLSDRLETVQDARLKVTRIGYDHNDNVETVTDPLDRTITYGYDVLDRRTTETDDLANTTTTEYDPVGNVRFVTDPLQQVTEYRYDDLNRPTHVIEDPISKDPLGLNQATVTEYDAVGNVLWITDPEENTTSYGHDLRNRVLSETNELGLARTFVYDAVGNRVSATDRNDRVRQFTFDLRNRQLTESWLDAALQPVHAITSSYDPDGRLLAISDPAAACATKIQWRSASVSSSLVVRVLSRERPSKKEPKFAPTSCGALYLNDGAAAYEADPATGMPVIDPETGEWAAPLLGPTDPLCLAAVKDMDGTPGIVGDGSGDEDQDGLTDLQEACATGTCPCNPDTDGDGLPDGEDPDPLVPLDTDGDGLTDVDDPDPDNPDTDGDGVLDGDDPDPLDPSIP